MFRDGIFVSFSDLLNTRVIIDIFSDRGYTLDEEELFSFLTNLGETELEYLEDALARGNEEEVLYIVKPNLSIETNESAIDEYTEEEREPFYDPRSPEERYWIENAGNLAMKIVDCLRDEGYRLAQSSVEGLEDDIKQIPEEKYEEVEDLVRFFSIEDFRHLFPGYELEEDIQNESKFLEQKRKEVEQTEMPKMETPKDDAERLSMEDWSDTDKEGNPKRRDNVEYPSKLYEPEEEEMKDNIRYENRKHPLYLCDECFKTFRNLKAVCIFCESKNVEKIVKKVKEKEEVPFLKDVYSVEYIQDSEKHETRVMAFDEFNAEELVKKDHPNVEVLSVKKISEVKVKEDYVEKHPGTFEVVFNDGHKETLDADSKVDAKQKARKAYPKSTISHVIAKEVAKEMPQEKGYEVTFYDGHKEVIKDAESKVDAIKKAKEIYKDSPGVQNVEVLEREVNEQEGVFEKPKLNEQDVEALRKRKLEIEQKMLNAEKQYREEQNRMGAEVDRLNQQIRAKEEQSKE